MPLPPTPRPPRLSRIEQLVALYSALALAGVGWGALRGHANVLTLPEPAADSPWIGLVAGVGLGLVVVGLTRVVTARFAWAKHLHGEFRHLLGALSPVEILVIAAASSVGEECFFRGALTPHLGLWASSALFALPHIGPSRRFLPWTATSFVLGLAMSGLFLASGHLGGAIVAHFTINFLNLRYIVRVPA